MTPLPRELPADREKALEAIAAGWTRQPTTAHPDCLCNGRAAYTTIRWITYGDQAPRPWPVKDKTVPCQLHSRRG